MAASTGTYCSHATSAAESLRVSLASVLGRFAPPQADIVPFMYAGHSRSYCYARFRAGSLALEKVSYRGGAARRGRDQMSTPAARVCRLNLNFRLRLRRGFCLMQVARLMAAKGRKATPIRTSLSRYKGTCRRRKTSEASHSTRLHREHSEWCRGVIGVGLGSSPAFT